MRYKRGTSRVHGYKFRPHGGMGLFCYRCIYIDGGMGVDVSHNRAQPSWTLYVGPIRIDPVVRD